MYAWVTLCCLKEVGHYLENEVDPAVIIINSV